MEAWRAFWGWIQLIASALIILAIATMLVVKFGFAWAVIGGVAGFCLRARTFDPGTYGENAYGLVLEGIYYAVCIAVGLIVRLVIAGHA